MSQPVLYRVVDVQEVCSISKVWDYRGNLNKVTKSCRNATDCTEDMYKRPDCQRDRVKRVFVCTSCDRRTSGDCKPQTPRMASGVCACVCQWYFSFKIIFRFSFYDFFLPIIFISNFSIMSVLIRTIISVFISFYTNHFYFIIYQYCRKQSFLLISFK